MEKGRLPGARKIASTGLLGGQTSEYDPSNPYVNVNVGLFHNVPIPLNGDEAAGIATYYLPDGMDPWAPAVIIMTPDHTTAKAFSNSVTGLQWRAVADRNKIGLAFVEPEDGGEWNLDLSADGRDDAALLDALYQLMRKKGLNLTGAFSMDKSHTALVGYEEGGAAALLFGGRWASDFSSIVAVDAAETPAASLAALGEGYVLPFPGDSTEGIEEEAIAAHRPGRLRLRGVGQRERQVPRRHLGQLLGPVQALHGHAAARPRRQGAGLHPGRLLHP